MRQLLALDHLVGTLVILVRLFRHRFQGRCSRRARCGCGWWRWWWQCRLWRRSRGLFLRLAADAENQLHVMTETAASDASVQIVFTGRGYEIVILTRQEL